MIHPSQLEEKFGGTQPNLTQYWPPHFPVTETYGEDPLTIMAEDEYENALRHNPHLVPRPDLKAKFEMEV